MSDNSLKYYLILLAVLSGLVLSAGVAAAVVGIKTPEAARQVKTFITIGELSTTTTQIPKNAIHIFDSEYLVQGACLKIKDIDGNGYTFLTVNNGAPNFSTVSCE